MTAGAAGPKWRRARSINSRRMCKAARRKKSSGVAGWTWPRAWNSRSMAFWRTSSVASQRPTRGSARSSLRASRSSRSQARVNSSVRAEASPRPSRSRHP
ncbi:MAG: hypothetical protein U0797_19085 [Gemmataceae bacterium]